MESRAVNSPYRAAAGIAAGPGPSGWSPGELHIEGVGDNGVTVAVEQDGGSYRAISTGRYDDSRRKVEAVFDVEDGRPRLVSWRELYE